MLYQVRWHGRGGQGAVTAAKILGAAASLYENYFAQSFPAFGVERRGAPVLAFTKIDSHPILDRSQIYEPDAVVVLDPRLLQSVDVMVGLKPGGQLVINCETLPIGMLPVDRFYCIAVDANKISSAILGKPTANTAMVGALAAVSNLISLDSVKKAIADILPAHLVEGNIEVAEAAYQAMKARMGEVQIG